MAASLSELEDIFVEDPRGCSHPVIARKDCGPAALYVEGCKCADLSLDTETQLLTWAVAFSVFCQKLTYQAVKNTATFLAVYIVKSDSCNKLPKGLDLCIPKLLNGTE